MKYILESDSSEYEKLINAKDSYIEELNKIEDFILSNVVYKDSKMVFRKGFNNIDIDEILSELASIFSEDIIKMFGTESFLRKIHQILEIRKRNVKKTIRDEFVNYNISIDNRLKKKEEEKKFINYFDDEDDEESILDRKVYEREKFEIQVELLKLQEWVVKNKKRVAIVCEGRDAAGKGSTIKRFTENLNPRGFRIVALGVPTPYESKHWFERYEKQMPRPGEIVFFDRSYYNRAIIEPSMGYCTEDLYKEFMENVVEWEESLIDGGIILIKFWFSITKQRQLKRFELRKNNPLKYWKFSENDLKSVSKWDVIPFYNNQMFSRTSSNKSPWIVIQSVDKRVGRLNSMRYVLSQIDYDNKNYDVCRYYPEVVNILK